MDSPIKVRFPPSPTGFCHVGTARMAILNYLFAKKNGGTIVFRSEDTDKARSRPEFEEDIKEQLQWLGLSWDEFYRTTDLVSTHTDAMQKLVAEDKACVSEEESKKEPGTMVQVVRLRNPGTAITFTDLIRGEITFDTTELGDFAIGRAIDDPLYHLAVVVDDASHGITHVIRGEDHISNTPRQILIQEALGYPRPQYAHYPLHLGADRSKLSKRTGDVAVKSYREKGFLPQALLNYIAVLGWTAPSGKELLSLTEMIEAFDIRDVHKSGAVFDMEKLRWFNREYILKLTDDEFAAAVLPIMEEGMQGRGLTWDQGMATKLLPVIKERVSVWSDLSEQLAAGEYDLFFKDPTPAAEEIPGKGNTKAAAATHLAKLHELYIGASAEIFDTPERLKDTVWEYATEQGRGAVLWPMRFSLSGLARSPDPFTIASIIGRDATLRRLDAARQLLI
ncbi:MAG: glutamyl-tRNA synthetase, glutamyl-tRNA synthetase [Candidatus Kaiserbacteria bacterium]|nr:glutamyl-tRNA synthetase, glutamyl-tRNA synthetase [Candidatus Kaiserbacteria bacterium]